VSSGDGERFQRGEEVQEFVKVVGSVGRDGTFADVLLEGLDDGCLQLGDSFRVAGAISFLEEKEAEQAAEGGNVDVEIGQDACEGEYRIDPVAETAEKLVVVQGEAVAEHHLPFLQLGPVGKTKEEYLQEAVFDKQRLIFLAQGAEAGNFLRPMPRHRHAGAEEIEEVVRFIEGTPDR